MITALTKHSKNRLERNELWKTIGEFEGLKLGQESYDRACALVLGAITEQGLETAITSHCIPLKENDVQWLFGGDQAGDTAINFASKIRLGYALGIYGQETKRDLNMIRHIRNTFAHSQKMISFQTKEVSDACDSLLFLKRPTSHPWVIGAFSDPRSCLIVTVRTFFAYFSDVRKGEPIKCSTHEYGHLFP